jgi:hypothetical protein
MAKDAKIICPMMGGEPCVEDGAIRNGELVACRFWVTVQGNNPQTGEIINHKDCSFAWMPVLMIENSQQQRQTGAAVESFRNEMVKTNDTNAAILLTAAQQYNQKLVEG